MLLKLLKKKYSELSKLQKTYAAAITLLIIGFSFYSYAPEIDLTTPKNQPLQQESESASNVKYEKGFMTVEGSNSQASYLSSWKTISQEKQLLVEAESISAKNTIKLTLVAEEARYGTKKTKTVNLTNGINKIDLQDGRKPMQYYYNISLVADAESDQKPVIKSVKYS